MIFDKVTLWSTNSPSQRKASMHRDLRLQRSSMGHSKSSRNRVTFSPRSVDRNNMAMSSQEVEYKCVKWRVDVETKGHHPGKPFARRDHSDGIISVPEYFSAVHTINLSGECWLHIALRIHSGACQYWIGAHWRWLFAFDNKWKWSKNFDERPHHAGSDLMWHRPVRSIAVGCYAVIEDWMDIIWMHTPQQWLPMLVWAGQPKNFHFQWRILTPT